MVSKKVSNIKPSLTLEITAKAKKMKASGISVIGFGAGEPDFNTPDYIINAAKHALDIGFTKYTPASGMQELKVAVCNKFKKDNGLYSVPVSASSMTNSPREKVYYPVDFNACMAINASYMSALGDILNDKDISFQYRKMYFSIKTKMNALMWDNDSGFYYDLDKDEKRTKVKTIASYWTMLAEIPNADKADLLVEHLNNPRHLVQSIRSQH